MNKFNCDICKEDFYAFSTAVVDRCAILNRTFLKEKIYLDPNLIKKLYCTCHKCFHKYLQDPKILVFEYNLGLI